MNDILKSIVAVPTYNVKLPSNDQMIEYRPFLVKEEKLLLLAMESNDNDQIYNAIKNILSNCIKTKIDIESLPYFDVEFLFIQIRMKSMGEVVEIIVTDPNTKEKFETTMDLNNIKVENLDKQKIKNYKINFTKESGVIIEYPSFKQFSLVTGRNKNSTELMFDFVCQSIKTIFSKDKIVKKEDLKPEEIIEFIESLPKSYYKKISTYFDKTPNIIYRDTFKSPTTGNNIPVIVRNFENFFT
jgi:hypothetical protein